MQVHQDASDFAAMQKSGEMVVISVANNDCHCTFQWPSLRICSNVHKFHTFLTV